MGEFWKDLKGQVNAYLSDEKVRKDGFRRLHRKAAVIVIWAVVSYGLLLMADSWWQVVVFGVSLVLALNAAGFNIMHDGNHGSFSRSKRLNRVAGFTLEMLGGSSFTWRVKHNRAHHTYPNVVGLDDDIDQVPMARLASSQEWKPWYRWQHLYLWPVYGLVAFRWQTFGDSITIARGRIGPYKLKGFNNRELAAFAGGKALFFGWAIALPMALHWSWHGALMVLVTYAGLNWLLSFVMVTTFQLAHCVDEAQFPSLEDIESDKAGNTWAIHQVMATSNFCPDNRIITRFVGGLNYQLEHHLFPMAAHVHYPAIAEMVRSACVRHGLVYLCQPTLREAVAGHFRHLRNMGYRPASAMTASTASTS